MAWREAIRADGEHCRLLVDVSAGAAEDQFPAGYNAWRGRIAVRVQAPAQGGKANAAVGRLVAAVVGAPAEVAAGFKDSRKEVRIAASQDHVSAQLEPWL